MASFDRRREISLSQASATVGANLGSGREARTGGEEEKGIRYPLMASNTSTSEVSFSHDGKKRDSLPVALTSSIGGSENGIEPENEAESGNNEGGSPDTTPLAGEPELTLGWQGLWSFPYVAPEHAATDSV